MESLYCLAPFRAFTPVMKEKACLAQALSSPHEVLILTSVMSSVSGSTKYEAIFPCERKSFLMTSPSLPPVSAGGRESAPREPASLQTVRKTAGLPGALSAILSSPPHFESASICVLMTYFSSLGSASTKI